MTAWSAELWVNPAHESFPLGPVVVSNLTAWDAFGESVDISGVPPTIFRVERMAFESYGARTRIELDFDVLAGLPVEARDRVLFLFTQAATFAIDTQQTTVVPVSVTLALGAPLLFE